MGILPSHLRYSGRRRFPPAGVFTPSYCEDIHKKTFTNEYGRTGSVLFRAKSPES